MDKNVLMSAAECGHLKVVRWLCKRPVFAKNVGIVSAAALNGHLEVVQWLCGERGLAMNEDVMERWETYPWGPYAAKRRAVEWLRNAHCEVMEQAASSGNLKLVQWLRAEGCDWNEEACGWAAKCGHLEVLQWLWSNGCHHFMGQVIGPALDQGHVEMLRWVRENGCWWDAEERDRAAEELGYTDNLGNLYDADGNPILSDDEYSDEYSDDE